MELAGQRHDYAVSLFAHVFQCAGYVVVVGLYVSYMGEQAHEVAVVVYLEAALFADRVIVERARQFNAGRDAAGTHLNGCYPGGVHLFPLSQRAHDAEGVAHTAHVLHRLGYGAEYSAPERGVVAERVQPAGQVNAELGYGELIERQLEYVVYVVRAQLQAVHADARHAVLLLQLASERLCLLTGGVGAVEHQYKGLADPAQLGDYALFSRYVALARNAADGAVRGHDHADGAVVHYDPARALFGGAAHGHLILEPRRRHHALHAVFKLSRRTVHHVADTVYEPHREADAAVKRDAHRLLGHEFGLRGHDGTSRAGLGQLILGALPGVDVLNVRYYQRLHKALYERALARAHGSHESQIDVAAGAGGYVMIY